MERKNIILTQEEGDFALTIMYPMSGEYSGKLFLIYEDAFGEADFKIMTPEAIAKNYNVSLEEINVFITEATKPNEENEEVKTDLRPIVKDIPDDYQLDN